MAACCDIPVMSIVMNGISMNDVAWNIYDLWDLRLGADARTGDVTTFGTVGRTSVVARPDLTVVILKLAITGEVDRAGTPADDDNAQLFRNVCYLRGNVTAPVDADPGTIPVNFTDPQGVVHSAGLRVGPLRFAGKYASVEMADGTFRHSAFCTLRVELPDGTI